MRNTNRGKHSGFKFQSSTSDEEWDDGAGGLVLGEDPIMSGVIWTWDLDKKRCQGLDRGGRIVNVGFGENLP